MNSTTDVFALAPAGGSVEGEFEVATLPRLAPMLAPPLGRIRFRLQARVDEYGRPAAALRIQLHCGMICDRCGARVDLAIEDTDGFFFVRDESELGALPVNPEGDEPLLGSRHFDVRNLVEEQAILALPISPRHAQCVPLPASDAPAQEVHRPFSVLAAHKRGTDIQ